MNARPSRDAAWLALVWLGPLLLAAGLANAALWGEWRSGRAGELLLIALVVLGPGAWIARRTKASLASVLLVAWLALLAVFAGPLPMAATGLFALACVAVGGLVGPQAPLAQQGLVGSLVLAGALGWLLQVPMHYPAVYWLACAALVAWRRHHLAGAFRDAKAGWQSAVSGSPRGAAFALVVLGLASTGCWPPTLQFDDLAYHLGLPWQLQSDAAYLPDPRVQVWALAPWATDVLQAVAQVMAGQEARGAVNGAWLAVLASGAWRLCRQLGAGPRAAWLSVALVASLPFTAALAGGMQTELATAAALLWLAVLVAGPAQGGLRLWVLAAILAGGLVAIKTTAAAMACVLLLWALMRHPWPSPARIVLVIGVGLAVASSSYVFAYAISGNPVLPLFNAWFGSPYFPLTNTLDLRWQSGFNAALPWNMTFHTHRFGESFDGGGGFALVALAGAWLAALLHRDLRALALAASAVAVIPLVPVQYLRYAYPGLVLLVPVLVVAGSRAAPASFAWLAVGLCVLNLGFQANSQWMLRTGLLKQTVLALGDDAPLFERYAPERRLAAMIRARQPEGRNVIYLSPTRTPFAEFGRRGRSPSWYAPRLQEDALLAERDDTGAAWAQLLANQQVGEIILTPAEATAAQRRGLERLGATHRATVGDAQWWSLPE